MLDRLRNWGLIILAILTAILGMTTLWERLGRERDRRKASEGARETEHAATDAMTSGQKREAKEANDAIDDARRRRRRDHFE